MCERERQRESPVRLGRVVNPESIYPNQLEKEFFFFLGGISTSYFRTNCHFIKIEIWCLRSWRKLLLLNLEVELQLTTLIICANLTTGNIFQQIQIFLGSDIILKKS